MTTAEHKRVVEELSAEYKALGGRLDAAKKLYAESFGSDIGLKIGSIVSQTAKHGYGEKARNVTKRYRVTRISPSHYKVSGLELHGVTIRKDGTDGERHELYGEWTLETEESQ